MYKNIKSTYISLNCLFYMLKCSYNWRRKVVDSETVAKHL